MLRPITMVRLVQTDSKHCIVTVTLMDVRIQAESERRAPGVDGTIRVSARQLRAGGADRLLAAYTATQKIRQVAAEFGLYRSAVHEHLKRRGVDMRQVGSMTESEVAEAVRLYEAGRSRVILGENLGFSNRTIFKALRTATVAIRRLIGRES